MEVGSTRAVVALLIPICVYFFYSPRLGLVLAIPYGYVFFWLVRRAVRRFTKREP
jgi:membrane protein implicated in regulation of membrane protease activity